MVNSITGNIGQQTYAKVQQATGGVRQFGVEGGSTAGLDPTNRKAQPNSVQESRSAELAGGRKGSGREEDRTGLDRNASQQVQNAEAQRGSLLDISV